MRRDPFDSRKQQVLTALLQCEGDRSRKGSVDAPIVDLVSSINEHNDMYTTSSCSGRVTVFGEPTQETREQGKKGGAWVYASHELAIFEDVHQAVEEKASDGGRLIFRFEPFILAVECRHLAVANRLIQICRQAGFRESGVTGEKRFMVGVRSALRLEVPVADQGRVLVSSEYLRYLVDLANEKFLTNHQRIRMFHELIREHLHNKVTRTSAELTAAPAGLTSGPVPQSEKMWMKAKSSQLSREGTTRASTKPQTISNRNSGIPHPSGVPPLPEAPGISLAPLLQAPPGSVQLWGHGSCVVGDKMVVFGGYGGPCNHCRLDDTFLLDSTSDHWQVLEVVGERPEPRMGHAMVALGDLMVVIGGRTSPARPLNDIWVMDLASQPRRWRKVETRVVDKVAGASVDSPPVAAEASCRWSGRYRHTANVVRRISALGAHVEGVHESGKDGGHSNLQALGHRLGSPLGDVDILVFGGKTGPQECSKELWLLSPGTSEDSPWCWSRVTCTGDLPPPVASHAAALVEGRLYICGGKGRDYGDVFDDLYQLDLSTWRWTHLSGGRRGSSGADLQSGSQDPQLPFEVQQDRGQPQRFPPTFSHTLTPVQVIRTSVRGDQMDSICCWYLLVVGGCPGLDHHHVYIYDIHGQTWSKLVTHLPDDFLPVRHTAHVLKDQLYVLGGGAFCFSFGTVFGQCYKSDLAGLSSALVKGQTQEGPTNHNEGLVWQPAVMTWHADTFSMNCANGLGREELIAPSAVDRNANCVAEVSPAALPGVDETGSSGAASCAYKLESLTGPDVSNVTTEGVLVVLAPRRQAKEVKDELKRYGWLASGSVQVQLEDPSLVALPVREEIEGELKAALEQQNHPESEKTEKGSLGRTVLRGLKVNCLPTSGLRPGPKLSPAQKLRTILSQYLQSLGLSEQEMKDLLQQVPGKWEKLGDLVLVPEAYLVDEQWRAGGEALWRLVAEALGARRVALQARIRNSGTRDSQAILVLGDDGWVEHKESGVRFTLDVTRCMFSSGNVTERTRMGRLSCAGETVVDLYTGIGYYTLPLLVRAGVEMVHACEWNPHAVEALRRNLRVNGVEGRCHVLEGDCRAVAPRGVADRVLLGLLPSSEGGWSTGLAALKDSGGILHIHQNVKDVEELQYVQRTSEVLKDLLGALGRHDWQVEVCHVEHVKWYAPHIRHIVMDVQCQPLKPLESQGA